MAYIWLAGAGFCSIFVGIGLNRFAFTPLIPLMIKTHWINDYQGSLLGATNFLGYLMGAAIACRLDQIMKSQHIILSSLILSLFAILFSAIQLNLTWLLCWRFVVGLTGAVLMVLTPAFILKQTPQALRNTISSMIFSGIGAGIIFSGLLVPCVAYYHLAVAWLTIAFFVFVSGLITAYAMYATNFISQSTEAKLNQTSIMDHENVLSQPAKTQLTIVLLLYGLFAYGMIPHTLYLVDYVHLRLHMSITTSGYLWSTFGLGACLGAILTSFLVNEIGVKKSLTLGFALGFIAIVSIVISQSIFIFYISALIVGVLLPSIVSLTSSFICELLGPFAHTKAWRNATILFALCQTLGAYFMSALIKNGVHYEYCFASAALCFLICFVVMLFSVNDF